MDRLTLRDYEHGSSSSHRSGRTHTGAEFHIPRSSDHRHEASEGGSRSHRSREEGRRSGTKYNDTQSLPKAKIATVLVIGPTQNGKSTFINRLRSLAVEETSSVLEGNGVDSCTEVCDSRDLVLPLTGWALEDIITGDLLPIPKDEGKMFGSMWRSSKPSKYKIVPIDPRAGYVKLKIIDTPGLDDSKGNDDRNIEEVLGYLNDMSKKPGSSISAIIFVTVHGAAFSSTFQELYRFYEKCMPNLFGAIAIVSTKFSVMYWSQKHKHYSKPSKILGGNESTKDQLMKERRTDFADTFGKDPMHFFIDSNPNTERLLEELLSRNTVSDILNFVAIQAPMEINQMRLCKSAKNRAIDAKLCSFLSSAVSMWAHTEEALLENTSESLARKSKYDKNIQICEDEVITLKENLRRFDNDSRMTLNSYSTSDHLSAPKLAWKWMTRQRIKNSLVISEPQYDSFLVVPCESRAGVARWVETGLNDTGKEWVGRYEANPGIVPHLTAQSFTPSRLFYAKEIRTYKASIRRTEDQIEDYERDRAQLLKDNLLDDPKTNEIQRLGSYIAKSVGISKELSEEEVSIEKGYGQAARYRYKKELSAVTATDLVAMLEEREPEMAKAVESIFKD